MTILVWFFFLQIYILYSPATNFPCPSQNIAFDQDHVGENGGYPAHDETYRLDVSIPYPGVKAVLQTPSMRRLARSIMQDAIIRSHTFDREGWREGRGPRPHTPKCQGEG